ncbi:proton-conducting transporter membrane subunit [Kocuria sp.]|uniref:complex I subunit 5 family protein n=1 Tax=Kocuria sp. TaxID=1871328 RepID=UPI0025C282E7|nr:proton-conducting transporter membrane subunit [Kocuria sp.]
MTFTQFSLGALVLFPLLTASATVVCPHRVRRIVGPLTALGVAVFTVPVVAAVSGGHTVELALSDFRAPLGIMLRADGLSALFLCLATIVGSIVTLYAALLPKATGTQLVSTRPLTDDALPPTRWQGAHPAFWPLWLACWAGLNAVFVSGDLFNTYVGLELVGLTAVALVALGGKDAWPAALRYLFIAVLGSLLFLVAVGLLLSATGTLDIEQASRIIAEQPRTHPAVVLALALVSLGLALKLALVPLHRWLIPAHAGAPGTVSPLLSALVIKASLFVLLRCWVWLAAPGMAPSLDPSPDAPADALIELTVLTWLLGGLGALAVIVGSVMALKQSRLKPLIAYSTVAQVGYWFLFFPILLDPTSDSLEDRAVTTLADDAVLAGAVAGTVALALGHGIAKAGLFLSAGFLKDVYGTDEIDALRGAGKRHPVLVMAMGMSAVGLAGLPVSLGFTGKWQVATSAVGAGHYWMLAVLVLGTLLSAAYLLKALAPLLVAAEDDDSEVRLPERVLDATPLLPQFAPFALGTLTVVTGLLGAWSASVLEVGAPW